MRKRITAALLVIVLAVALTSCAGTPAAQTPTQAPAAQPTAAPAPAPAAPAATAAAQTAVPAAAPAAQDPVPLEIAMVVNAKVEDIDTNTFTKYLEESANIDITFEVLPAQDTLTKINLMLTSNDLPDVFFHSFTRLQVVDYSAQGYLIPLDQYIDTLGVNTKKVYAEAQANYVEKYLRMPDGLIYSLPSITESASNTYNDRCWVYEPWLKALNIAMPTTIDEFTAMLEAFKTKDPNGNGKADEIPMLGYDGQNIVSYIGNAYQFTPVSNHRQVVGGKVRFSFMQPEYRQTLEYLNKLINDGLFDPVSFTQAGPEWKAIVAQDTPIVGVLPKEQKSAAADVTSQRGMEYIIIPPLKGPSGFVTTTEVFGAVGYAGSITRVCANPEAAFKLMDFMLTREASMAGRYGVKGAEWTDPDPGAMGNSGRPAIFKIVKDVWGMPSSNVIWYASNYPTFLNVHDDLQAAGDPYEYNFQLMQSSLNDYAPLAEKEYMPPIILSEEDTARLDELTNTINTYVKEQTTAFITGARGFDTWDAFAAEFPKLGVDECLQLLQKALDEWNASN